MKYFLLFSFITLTHFISAEEWNTYNRPEIFSDGYNHFFYQLPLEATLPIEKTPWADSYWPNFKAGLAHRWSAGDKHGFKYKTYGLAELKTLSTEKLARLSPAEKYDILRGDYNYTLVQHERGRTRKGHSEWYGICHGIAPASVQFQEPRSKVIRNKDGIDVPLYSSDIKAMMAIQFSHLEGPGIKQLGLRCSVGARGAGSVFAQMRACRDVNAGAFHIILSNQIGIIQKAFIADMTRDKEVWNHPFINYKSVVVGERQRSPGAARQAVKEIVVKTTASYADSPEPQEEPFVGTDNYPVKTKDYHYALEIDSLGRIVGGSWISWERPDFLWISNPITYANEMPLVQKIFNEYDLTKKEP